MQRRDASTVAYRSPRDSRNISHRSCTQVLSTRITCLTRLFLLPKLPPPLPRCLLVPCRVSASVIHLLSLTVDRFRLLTGSEQTDVRVLRALQDECIEWQRPVAVRSGWDVWCEWKGNLLVFSTGCDELDAVLAGGVMTDEITELVGESSSGKHNQLQDTLSASLSHTLPDLSVCAVLSTGVFVLRYSYSLALTLLAVFRQESGVFDVGHQRVRHHRRLRAVHRHVSVLLSRALQ